MTTNVYDGVALQIATESRWSTDLGDGRCVCIDDTGFDKIEVSGNKVFMFAGDALEIDAWKQWIRTGQGLGDKRPTPRSISICIIKVPSGKIAFEKNQGYVLGPSRFAGTGYKFARDCWMANKDARRAVKSAIAADILSGGEVKYFEVTTGANNLNGNASYTDVVMAMKDKGMIMDKMTGVATPLSEVATGREAQEIAEKIVSGELRLSAPCEVEMQPWTDEELAALDSALNDND